MEQILSMVSDLLLKQVGLSCDKALKNKTWCNKVRHDLPHANCFCIDIDLNIHTHITCIVHDLVALGVT